MPFALSLCSTNNKSTTAFRTHVYCSNNFLKHKSVSRKSAVNPLSYSPNLKICMHTGKSKEVLDTCVFK